MNETKTFDGYLTDMLVGTMQVGIIYEPNVCRTPFDYAFLSGKERHQLLQERVDLEAKREDDVINVLSGLNLDSFSTQKTSIGPYDLVVDVPAEDVGRTMSSIEENFPHYLATPFVAQGETQWPTAPSSLL